MKTRTKALLLALCAVAIVAASVLGTLAYLTDKDQVVNTFTVGDVKLILDEHPVDADSEYQNLIDDAEKRHSTGNTYDLVPAQTYEKDPTVWLDAKSEDSFVFVAIKNDILAIENNKDNDVLGEGETAYVTIAEQMAANGWNLFKAEEKGYAIYVWNKTADETANGVKLGHTTAQGLTAAAHHDNADGETYYELPVFESFKVEETKTNTEMAAYANTELVVKAYAIQYVGVETAAQAWTLGTWDVAATIAD